MEDMEKAGAPERDPFIRGYFRDRVMNGETPDYGYPKNHLPPVTDKKMPIKSGFMTSRMQQK